MDGIVFGLIILSVLPIIFIFEIEYIMNNRKKRQESKHINKREVNKINNKYKKAI